MGFKNAKKIIQATGSAGRYFKFTPGDSFQMVLCNDVVWGPALYNGKGFVPADWSDLGTTPDVGIRFACSAYDIKGEMMKELSGPKALYEALGSLFDDDDIDVYNSVIKVTCQSNKAYKAMYIKPCSAALQEAIAGEELMDLSQVNFLDGVDLDAMRAKNKEIEDALESDDD